MDSHLQGKLLLLSVEIIVWKKAEVGMGKERLSAWPVFPSALKSVVLADKRCEVRKSIYGLEMLAEAREKMPWSLQDGGAVWQKTLSLYYSILSMKIWEPDVGVKACQLREGEKAPS